MKRKCKKLTALLLVLTMCLSLLPTTSRAEELNYEGESSAETLTENTEENISEPDITEESSEEESSTIAVEETEEGLNIVESEEAEEELTIDDMGISVTSTEESEGESVTESETSVEFAGGDGTEDNPYQVATAEQLDAVRNDLTAYYILTSDIDLSFYEDWVPIGCTEDNNSTVEVFSGTLDGNGYTISSLSITAPYAYMGLFGSVSGSITNLIISDITIDCSDETSTNIRCGGVTGSCTGKMSEVEVHGNITVTVNNDSTNYYGGICGYGGSGTLSNLVSDVAITISSDDSDLLIGGIAGYGSPIYCTNYGNISGTADNYIEIGGIAGRSDNGDITYCVNYGDITATLSNCSGYADGRNHCNLGGICGWGEFSDSGISYCINYGTIYGVASGTSGGYTTIDATAGGITGVAGFIDRHNYWSLTTSVSYCYNFGNVTGITNITKSGTTTTDYDSNVGLICGVIGSYTTMSENASCDTSLVNGETPDESETGSTTKHGEILTEEEMADAIASILEELGIEESSIPAESGFIIGVDSNSFAHSNDASLWSNAGFVGVTNYSLDDEYFEKLKSYATEGEVSSIKEILTRSWNGACYGIAATIGLLYENDITISDLCSNADEVISYYTLPYPSENSKLLNNITYYYLLQYLKASDETALSVSMTKNVNKFSGFFLETLFGYDNLSDFLEKLVEYAMDGETLIFSYGDHAVLVTGCTYDSENDVYSVEIFDENTVISDEIDGYFTYMEVAGNFSAFRYANLSNDSYSDMHFSTVGALKEFIYSSANSVSASVSVSSSSNQNTWIKVSDAYSYVITNKEGAVIIYDGTSFSGDMTIYAIDSIGNDTSDGTETGFYIIETDSSDSFTVSEISAGMDIAIYDDDNFLSLKGTGIESAGFSLDGGMTLIGSNYSFTAFISTDEVVGENENGLISIEANAKDDVKISKDNEAIKVSSEKSMDDVTLSSYIGVDVINEFYEEITSDIDVSANELHVYSYIDNKDNTHTAICEYCGNSYTDIHQYVNGVCILCGAIEDSNTEHDFESPVYTWSEKYISCTASFTCSHCGETETVDCIVSSTVTDATCTEDGEIVYTATCSFNDKEYTNTQALSISSTGHSYEAVVTEPTCTEGGYTTYTCPACGDSYVDDQTEALGHTTETQNTKAATCTEDGYTGDEVCTICGEMVTEGDVIPATGHDTVKLEAKEATETENGNIEYWYCADCDTYFSDETLTTEITLADTVIPTTGNYDNFGDLDDNETNTTVDLTELEDAIIAAKDLDTSGYTDESVAAYEEALANAQSILADENATQEEIDAALEDLQAAIAALTDETAAASEDDSSTTDTEASSTDESSDGSSSTTDAQTGDEGMPILLFILVIFSGAVIATWITDMKRKKSS